MLRPISRLVLVLASTALAGACTQSTVSTGSPDYQMYYYPGLLNSVVKGGEMPTVILGNPFGPGKTDPNAIAAMLPHPGIAQPFNYRAVSANDSRRSWRVILVFNPAIAARAESDTCIVPNEELVASGGGPISVKAVFCAPDRWTTTVVGFGPPATGPDDPNFRQLMNAVISQLLPTDQPTSNKADTGGLGFEP
jgi:hypothetical protein